MAVTTERERETV